MFSEIRLKIRGLLEDNLKTQKDIFTYSNSRIFSLSQDNVDSITTVFKNSVEVTESGNWSYSETTNKLTIDDSYDLTDGDIIEIDSQYYENYSDNELDGYIKSAMIYCSIHNYKTFETQDDDINPEPSEAEKNLLALIASIIINPNNISYRLGDVNIQVPINSLPKEKMISRVIGSFKRDSHGIFTVIEDIECN